MRSQTLTEEDSRIDRDKLRATLVFVFVLAAVAVYFNRSNQLDVICQKLLSLDVSVSRRNSSKS
jgi:hypothetical protein